MFEPFIARTAAESIRRELEAGDEDFAFRMLVTAIADLRKVIASGDEDGIESFLDIPDTTGDERWDALLAAQIGRELRRAGFDLPTWTTPHPLARFWFVNLATPMLAARTMQRTSPDLACLGIWLDDHSFNRP